MATLIIESWSEAKRWASEGSWPLKAFCDRLQMCSNLYGTELKRTAKQLRAKEIAEIPQINAERAEPLIHTLESLGAKVAIKN